VGTSRPEAARCSGPPCAATPGRCVTSRSSRRKSSAGTRSFPGTLPPGLMTVVFNMRSASTALATSAAGPRATERGDSHLGSTTLVSTWKEAGGCDRGSRGRGRGVTA
jgi:hypothetical protein